MATWVLAAWPPPRMHGRPPHRAHLVLVKPRGHDVGGQCRSDPQACGRVLLEFNAAIAGFESGELDH